MTVDTIPSSLLLQRRHSVDIFGCTIVISLILHLAASTFLLIPGRHSVPAASLITVDLQSMVTPPEEPAVKQAEEIVSPEPLPLPEPTPEVAKLEKAIDSSLQKAATVPESVHESSIGLGMISGHFASFAEGESLKDEIRVYYFELMRRINEYWWTSGAAKGSFTTAVSVNLVIARDGKVVACDLFESSGNREQDQQLLEAIKKAQPLPALPVNFPRQTFNAPIRFVPPLRLMSPFGNKRATAPH